MKIRMSSCLDRPNKSVEGGQDKWVDPVFLAPFADRTIPACRFEEFNSRIIEGTRVSEIPSIKITC